MADTKVEKPKGPIGKLKDAMDDKEEQLAILSTFVRLGILIWSGGILTLNYVTENSKWNRYCKWCCIYHRYWSWWLRIHTQGCDYR